MRSELASYDYPAPLGWPLAQCLALLACALLITWQLRLGRGEDWWDSALVRVVGWFGVGVLVFMTWVAATG